MNILSIRDTFDDNLNFFSGGHDSSICIISNGKITSFLKEERFSRRKKDPNSTLTFELVTNNLIENVDFLVWITSKEDTELERKKILRKNKSIKIIKPANTEHHLYHASIAFYNSGFEKSLVVVIDSASDVSESVYLCEYPNTFKLIYSNEDPIVNLCNVYDSTTTLIGLRPTENGKTMGLSSYGDRISNCQNLFTDVDIPTKNTFYVKDIKNFTLSEQLDEQLLSKVPKKIEITKDNYQIYADYCKEIQVQTQDAVSKLVDKVVSETGVKNICISGGYGMNVVSNYNLLKNFPSLNFYFEPLCDDGGISIGAGMYYYRKYMKDSRIFRIETTAIHGFKYDVARYFGETKNISDIAKLLYENKSIAVYSGLSESGQRALGNRSILYNALNKDAKDIVNQIKKREWYRPFAAVVLEEDAPLYFDMGKLKSSPFMTACFPVKTDLIPGVTHVDNTCRVQTVSSGYLYELLIKFKELSGHGILLNTSFNLAGEPLVETPKDAFKTLSESSLDYLWFQETEQIFRKKNGK